MAPPLRLYAQPRSYNLRDARTRDVVARVHHREDGSHFATAERIVECVNAAADREQKDQSATQQTP